MLLPVALAVAGLEDLVNRALDLDPGSRLRLNALLGRSVLVKVLFPPLDILIYLDQDKVRLTPLEAQESPSANTTVSASSFALIRQLLKVNEPFSVGELQISGDTALLQELHAIARDLDIDWESALSQLVGDAAAHQIGEGLRGFFRFAKQAASDIFKNSTTYLRESGQWFPPRWQVDDYVEEVQELRSDIERFEARMLALKKRLDQAETPVSPDTADSGGRS